MNPLKAEAGTNQNSESSGVGQIPRHFIFVYGLHPRKEPFHLIHYLCLRSCLDVNRPERITLYSPEQPYGHYWELIKPDIEHVAVKPVRQVTEFHYSDRAIDPYRYAHHSDFIRLEKLLAHGGVYADLDTLFVNPVPDELFLKQFVLGRERDIADPRTGQLVHSLCNAVIMSAAGADFCHRWHTSMDEAFDGTWSNHSTLLPQRLADSYPQDIHIEPESAFFHFPPTNEGISLLFDTRTSIPDNTYSIHLWAHLWWSGTRVDFSAFDAERVTEEYIREADTTYAVAARLFLPKTRPSLAFEFKRQKNAGDSARMKRTALHRREEERAQQQLNKLGQRQEDEEEAGLQNQALRALTFHRAMRKLDIHDGFEEAILRAVILQDEYALGARKFESTDTIIDIGAHLGAFSLLCHSLGSRRVFAYEPDPRNYARLEQHLDAVEGIHPDPRAVFRSDSANTAARLIHSGPQGVNTGGGNVIMGGLEFAPVNQQAWLLPGQTTTVETIPLDELLRRLDRVTLLKLDCEGSEFPILLTSKELGRVDEIVGEYHEVNSSLMPRLDPEAKVGGLKSFSIGLLGAKLQSAGFEVRFSRTQLNLGYFHAIRC